MTDHLPNVLIDDLTEKPTAPDFCHLFDIKGQTRVAASASWAANDPKTELGCAMIIVREGEGWTFDRKGNRFY